MSKELKVVNKNQGLETLEFWRMAIDFVVDVCQAIVPLLPPEEKWALGSQLRRSVQSISANIAEGYGRYSYQDPIHFCYIARGSMAETKTHLILANRLGYLDDQTYQKYQTRLSELGKMLNGYIKHLRNQKNINCIKENSINEEEYGI